MSRTIRLKRDPWKLREAPWTFRMGEDGAWIDYRWNDRFDCAADIRAELMRDHIRARADRCPGDRNAPAWFRREINGKLRAKHRRELRRMIEDEDAVLTPFKRNANWSWF